MFPSRGPTSKEAQIHMGVPLAGPYRGALQASTAFSGLLGYPFIWRGSHMQEGDAELWPTSLAYTYLTLGSKPGLLVCPMGQ
jgi:hypothetical protein